MSDPLLEFYPAVSLIGLLAHRIYLKEFVVRYSSRFWIEERNETVTNESPVSGGKSGDFRPETGDDFCGHVIEIDDCANY
jgi:hypothetical protein